jgi:predicted Zn-dependent protease with MMP-like domain
MGKRIGLCRSGSAFAAGPGSGVSRSRFRGALRFVARFDEYAEEAIESMPAQLRAQMSNVEIVVEDEPPPGQRLLGLYQGVPLTRRGSHYGGVLPDKVTVYSGPLLRLYGDDPERLRREVRRGLSSTRSPITSGSATSACSRSTATDTERPA